MQIRDLVTGTCKQPFLHACSFFSVFTWFFFLQGLTSALITDVTHFIPFRGSCVPTQPLSHQYLWRCHHQHWEERCGGWTPASGARQLSKTQNSASTKTFSEAFLNLKYTTGSNQKEETKAIKNFFKDYCWQWSYWSIPFHELGTVNIWVCSWAHWGDTGRQLFRSEIIDIDKNWQW